MLPRVLLQPRAQLASRGTEVAFTKVRLEGVAVATGDVPVGPREDSVARGVPVAGHALVSCSK